MFQQGKLDRAITEYREAIRLAPGSADARSHLAQALINQGKLDLGIETYREAIGLAPQFPAPTRRPRAPLCAGEATSASRRRVPRGLRAGDRSGITRNDPAELTRTSAGRPWQNNTRMKNRATIDRSPAENLDRAYYFYERQRHARSADLFNRALDQDPGLIGDANNQNRYNAACANVLAAAAMGKNEPTQSEADRMRLRQLARDYLKADLRRWLKILGNSSQRPTPPRPGKR